MVCLEPCLGHSVVSVKDSRCSCLSIMLLLCLRHSFAKIVCRPPLCAALSEVRLPVHPVIFCAVAPVPGTYIPQVFIQPVLHHEEVFWEGGESDSEGPPAGRGVSWTELYLMGGSQPDLRVTGQQPGGLSGGRVKTRQQGGGQQRN